MQLTRQEVLESQLLVTTPEKYDVVTRKGGDGSLGTLVSLIIIDEVHLLAEDRGAVLETIVARTQRYIESSQHMVLDPAMTMSSYIVSPLLLLSSCFIS
jgi:replicative superfamily II helicase